MPVKLFTGVPWEQYIREMSAGGTYGDEIIVNSFSVEICIISTLGEGVRVKITPNHFFTLGQNLSWPFC